MRNLTKENITEAFVQSCNKKNKQNCSKNNNGDDDIDYDANPRTMKILTSLCTHLHAFALEMELTHEEWSIGIDFLKRVGNKTTPQRDEFVLLSDVLGLSSLIDMIGSSSSSSSKKNDNINDNIDKTDHDITADTTTTTTTTKREEKTTTSTMMMNPTSSSVLGPFHLSNPPELPMGSDLKRNNGGELVLIQGRVLDSTTGLPIGGATVNVWQTAPNGLYSSQDPENQDQYNFHALLSKTSKQNDGMYSFTTSKPIPYKIPTDGPVGELLRALGRHSWRPSHLHYIVEANGYKPLVTELFPDDDPYLEEDAVFGVRDDLVLTYTRQSADSFPSIGFDLSGKVYEDFWKVDFDLILTPL